MDFHDCWMNGQVDGQLTDGSMVCLLLDSKALRLDSSPSCSASSWLPKPSSQDPSLHHLNGDPFCSCALKEPQQQMHTWILLFPSVSHDFFFSVFPPSLLIPPRPLWLSPSCHPSSLQSESASLCVWKYPRRRKLCRAIPWSCAASPAWRGRRWRPPLWWNGSTGLRAVKISLYVRLLPLVFCLLVYAVVCLAPDSLGDDALTWHSLLSWALTSPQQITDSLRVAQGLCKAGTRPAVSNPGYKQEKGVQRGKCVDRACVG